MRATTRECSTRTSQGQGLDIVVEDSTSHGRLDMAVRFNGAVYLFELEVVELAGERTAMVQLQARRVVVALHASSAPAHGHVIPCSGNCPEGLAGHLVSF